MDQEAIQYKEIKDIPAKYREPTKCLDEQLLAANQILAYRDLKIRSLVYEEVKRTGIFNKHLELARQQLSRVWEKYEEKCQELNRERERSKPILAAEGTAETAEHTGDRHRVEKFEDH